MAVAACAEPDPVFAAIEACLEAERTYAEAWARLEEARDRFKEKYGREEPDAFSKALREGFAKQGFEKFSKAACDSHQTVDRLIDAMYSARGTNMQETRARLHEELDRQTAAYNETVKPLDDANNDAYERFDNLFQTLVDTQPTTLSGLVALFACLRDNKMLREQIWAANDDYIHKFIATLGTATAKFAKT